MVAKSKQITSSFGISSLQQGIHKYMQNIVYSTSWLQLLHSSWTLGSPPYLASLCKLQTQHSVTTAWSGCGKFTLSLAVTGLGIHGHLFSTYATANSALHRSHYNNQQSNCQDITLILSWQWPHCYLSFLVCGHTESSTAAIILLKWNHLRVSKCTNAFWS